MVKNIIIVNDYSFVNGGAGNVAISSAKGLAELGYNVILFTAVGDDGIKNRLKVISLKQGDLLSGKNKITSMIQGIYNIKAEKEFNKLLSEYEPDDTIIHLHGWYKALSPVIWKSIRNKGFKFVVTLHDYFLICPNGGLYNYPHGKICKEKPSSIKCLVSSCDSRSYPIKIWRDVRQLYQLLQMHKVSKDKFNVIYISKLNKDVTYPFLKKYTNKWYYLSNPVELKKELIVDVKKNSKYLFMGRLSSEKGLDLFCHAISELGLEGVVVGDGYMKAKFEGEYKNIEFTGWLTGEKKLEVINKCKCLVFPSRWYEGAPLTIIELQSLGMPCIVPDRCAASEEVIDNQTGFVFRSGDVNSLKAVLQKAENCNLSIIQQNILDTFHAEKYELRNHCMNLLQIYDEILKN